MTQFDNPYAHPASEAPKTSGLAITALVFSLVGIIPCLGLLTAPIGLILGVIAMIAIGANPGRKGTGLAITAVVLGLVFAGAQGAGTWWVVNKGREAVVAMTRGPNDALKAGFAGDIAGFKAGFYGSGSMASDEEATAFINQLRTRYGEFVSCRMDESRPAQPVPGQPSVPAAYIIEFQNATMNAESEIIFADQATGAMPFKPGYIVVFDKELGDLKYPAN
jgi:hypothetical protein